MKINFDALVPTSNEVGLKMVARDWLGRPMVVAGMVRMQVVGP